ncbi:MAG: hypothetical protein R2729_01310 [Bryobacteraceae bacterium]
MLVRLRLGRGTEFQDREGKNRPLALASAGLLAPAAVMAFILAMWRLAADLSLASNFAIEEGPLSHWHVWVLLAAVLAIAAVKLNRYGRGGRPTT